MRDALPVVKGRKIAKPTPGGERTFPGQPVLLSEGVVSLSFLVIRSMVLGGAVPLSVGLYSASSQRESLPRIRPERYASLGKSQDSGQYWWRLSTVADVTLTLDCL